MRVAAVALLLLLLLPACRAHYRVYDTSGERVVLEGSFSGRGCIAIDQTSGQTSAIVDQAGEDNWAGIFEGFLSLRFLGELAGNVFGGSGTTPDTDRELMGWAGCSVLFEQDESEMETVSFDVVPVE